MSDPPESSPGEPESFVVIPVPEPAPASTSAPTRVSTNSSSSDTSFEEIQEDCADITDITDSGAGAGAEAGDGDGGQCNDSVRQVLDDVEAQIETLRDAVTRLDLDKQALLEVLEGIGQTLPGTPLSEVEKEEVELEVGRLRGRVEEVRCDLETRRTDTQRQSLEAVEAKICQLVRLVETDCDGARSSQTCRGYLAACGGTDLGGQTVGQTCHKFEALVLGCAVEDQKMIRRRLSDLLNQIEILADNKQT